MAAVRSLFLQANAEESFVGAIGSDIGAFMKALALGKALLVCIALIEANIIEDAFILAAIERAEDGFSTFEILAVKDGERVLIELLGPFKHSRKGRACALELVRGFWLNRRETVAGDTVDIL